MSDENLQPVFQIQRVYLKDLSLEQPNSPAIFLNKKPLASKFLLMSAMKNWRMAFLNPQ
jgi:preprotein translocase subunit SecB